MDGEPNSARFPRTRTAQIRRAAHILSRPEDDLPSLRSAFRVSEYHGTLRFQGFDPNDEEALDRLLEEFRKAE